MTDFSINHTEKPQPSKRQKSSKGEYVLYFSLIFLSALVICSVMWGLSVIRHMRLPQVGPVRAAWSEAQTVTSCIFWG